MPYRVNRREITVEWGHCDPAGQLFISRVFEYFDWSTALLFEANLGHTKSALQSIYDADIPLVDVKAEILHPCRFCDVLASESSISAFRRSSFDVTHQLFRGSILVISGQETRVWVGRDPHNPGRARSKPVPSEVIAACRRDEG